MCFRNPLDKKSYQLPSQGCDSDEDSSPLPQHSGFVAIKMIELEMQLEQTCTLEIVQKLSKLYSQAIEYFDNQEDPKCYDIQNKLHTMLKRSDVVKLLANPDGSEKFFHSSPEKQDFDTEKTEFVQSPNDSLETEKQNSAACADLISKEANKAQEVTEKIVNSFSAQETNLESRKNQRRSSMQSRNSSFCSGFIEKSDVSAGGFRSDMQLEIEEFLENHFAQQSHAISDINVRYETEINKLDGQGGVFALVVEQMRKNKEDEVGMVKGKFENIRREAIGIIRKKYLAD